MHKNFEMIQGKYGPEPSAESILKEINKGGWSTGYTGQSPERLKLHMQHQDKFDLVSLRGAAGSPVENDFYGLPWPCWGHAGTQASRHPHPLQHLAGGRERRRHLPPALWLDA